MKKVAQGVPRLISGRTHPRLAEKVAKQLHTKLVNVELGNFASSEISCRLTEPVKGEDVFVIQSHAGDVNWSIMEQAIMIDAAKRGSARSITAVCPLLGYTRQDRVSKTGEPISAKLVVGILASAGADRIISVDLHSDQIEGFFDGPFEHIRSLPIFCAYHKKRFKQKVVIVSPDAGRVNLAKAYAIELDAEIAMVHKQRSGNKPNIAEARYLVGNVQNKVCIIVDDMIDTAGTVCAAADLLDQNGAREIHAVATHGIFSDVAIERLNNSVIKTITVTDTVPPLTHTPSSKIFVISVISLLSDSIKAVY